MKTSTLSKFNRLRDYFYFDDYRNDRIKIFKLIKTNKEMLDYKERKWLNDYHRKVFYKLKRTMNRNEILELKNACSAI